MQTVILIIVSIVNIILWIFLFRFLKKNYSTNQLSEVRDEAEKLIMEIDRATDRDITLLEGRIKSLRDLIAEADHRVDLERKESSKKVREKKILNTLHEITLSEEPSTATISTHPVKRAINLYEQNKPLEEKEIKVRQSEIEPAQGIEVEKEDIPEITIAHEPIKQTVSAKQQILDLANQGFSSDVISEKLQISMTEVNMVVEMFGIIP